ncbi:MAG: hypothetical protein A2Z20_11845 [Bdellovibrionales bacterium RBG_16_40_8]|nr:MAG: hypothetical protein A2Z20_11845 [Bdellovibrionales bacterium RBG_16_40_8]
MNYKSFFWQLFFAITLLCVFFMLILHAFMQNFSEVASISITIGLIIIVAFFMSYRLSRPLEALRHHLKKMAEGDISDRMRTLKTEVVEIHELANAMETIRDHMQQRIHTILMQKSEQDALLASMVEGVVAVDHAYQILHINSAAGNILGVSPESVIGQNIDSVIKEKSVLDTVRESLVSNKMIEKDIEFSGGSKKYLQLHASPMQMPDDFRYGVVLVFSDVTRLRELENIRRDFVSNVSHELRTPLTSIQGFAETLLNPSVKDPNEIKRFLEIIQRHAARLGRIIEDILALSRLERDAEFSQIELKEAFIDPVISSAVELCHIRADKKKISLQVSCAQEIKAAIDPYLLEQAIVNLIDNAIRYSDEAYPIQIKVVQEGKEILISVKDQGIGISESQLPRIFERFYRVDKARSRELGGTGLGLSIVKHISLAHHGRIEVKSKIGEGTTFTIFLPAV